MSAFSKIVPGKKSQKRDPKPPKQQAKPHGKRPKATAKRRPRPIGH